MIYQRFIKFTLLWNTYSTRNSFHGLLLRWSTSIFVSSTVSISCCHGCSWCDAIVYYYSCLFVCFGLISFYGMRRFRYFRSSCCKKYRINAFSRLITYFWNRKFWFVFSGFVLYLDLHLVCYWSITIMMHCFTHFTHTELFGLWRVV